MNPEIDSLLVEREQLSCDQLRAAFRTARNRHLISASDPDLLRRSKGSDLNAASPPDRTKLARAAWGELERHFDLGEHRAMPDVPLYFMTAVDIGCMTPLTEMNVDIASFGRHLISGLKGLSSIGMIDPALYDNIGPGTNFAEKTGINWHIHWIVWGEDRREFEARVAAMNAKANNYRPIIPRPRGVGVHWQPVTEDNIGNFYSYIFKFPLKSYRIGLSTSSRGEVRPAPKLMQNKRDMRPGQLVVLFNLLKQFDLADLLVASGEGVDLRRRALRALR